MILPKLLQHANSCCFDFDAAGHTELCHRIGTVNVDACFLRIRKKRRDDLFVTVVSNIQLGDFVSFHCFKRLLCPYGLADIARQFQAHETSLLTSCKLRAAPSPRHLDIVAFPHRNVNAFFVKTA